MFEHTLIGIMLVLITTLPLAWKWQLGMRRIALLVILLALLSGLIVTFLENLISINVLIRPGRHRSLHPQRLQSLSLID